MDFSSQQARVYRFLFRMAARAAEFEMDDFLTRLVTGLANRYGASACSLYRYGRKRCTAWAPTSEDIEGLPREDKAYLHNLDGRLVQHAIHNRGLVSGMDLDVDGDVATFLADVLPGTDIFAFPLLVDEGPRGAIVMYIPMDGTSLSETDLNGLMAIGEVLEVAEEQQVKLKQGQERIRQAKGQTSSTTRRKSAKKKGARKKAAKKAATQTPPKRAAS